MVSRACEHQRLQKETILKPSGLQGGRVLNTSETMSASFLSAMNTRAEDAGRIADLKEELAKPKTLLISQSDFENIHRAFTDFDFDDDDDEKGLVDYVEEAIQESKWYTKRFEKYDSDYSDMPFTDWFCDDAFNIAEDFDFEVNTVSTRAQLQKLLDESVYAFLGECEESDEE